MRVRVIAALVSVAVFMCGAAGAAQTTTAPASTAGPATMPMAAEGPLALDARFLRGARTGTATALTGRRW
jgi:hypothetical protein